MANPVYPDLTAHIKAFFRKKPPDRRAGRRWRVENGWGEEAGRKGFFIMNDNWFDEHMFEIAARRDRLPDELREALEQEPIELPPWDPMGSLARQPR